MKLTTDTLDNGAAVINFDDLGGYVMAEKVSDTEILLTVFNDEGEVLFERQFEIGVLSSFHHVRTA